MAEKSSLMGKKSSFKGKNRVLSFLVKSSFPQNAQKKGLLLYNSLNKLHQRRFLVQRRSDLYLTFSLGFTIKSNFANNFSINTCKVKQKENVSNTSYLL